MTTIGTPFTANAKKVLICGAGELGKELAIELQRYGIEVIAIDAYPLAWPPVFLFQSKIKHSSQMRMVVLRIVASK